MPKKVRRYRALKGLDLADGTRVEAGELCPEGFEPPDEWIGEKVEAA